MAFCTVHAYAAVFLLAHGFTNTQVGVLLALANISSAVCQPLVAAVIDRKGFVTNRNFIMFSVFIILAGSLILLAVQDNKIAVFVIYLIIYMIQFTYQPVMTALCFEYQKAGCDIMYGLSRGLGSAGFAVTSAMIGGLVEKKGVNVLLIVTAGAMAASLIVILTFRRQGDVGVCQGDGSFGSRFTGTKRTVPPAKETTGPSPCLPRSSLTDFARAYPEYTLFLAGIICFFFAHNMINDFMIQIIRERGGAETQLGIANFLQAILELPVMALIGAILKKVSARNLLLVSSVAFFIKIMILIFTHSMAGMYISQSFQILAYALFIPAAAYYVSETMSEHDQVKGQAFITTAITIGGIFSNFVSGRILDRLGVRPMLMTGAAVCFAGVIIAFIAMRKQR